MTPEASKSLNAFCASLSAGAPSTDLSAPLQALWWSRKDAWTEAHTLVQGDQSAEAAWVHAYLHRVEGDLSNAAYWYRRADKEPSTVALDAEWTEIAAAFLDQQT